MIRVLLADDQALVRAGFRALLESADDISVVAEAQNGGAAVALVRELTPDVVLMDLNMPEVDGLTATGRITADPALAAVKVVVLTTFDDDEHVFAALRAGASGFLVKDIEPEELLQAVRVVARGDALLAPSVTRSLIAAFTRQPAQAPAARAAGAGAGPGAPGASSGDARAVARQVGLASLTDREREVVALVAAGLSNDEIAARLVVSPLTAKTHVSRSMTKLAARDRAQLVVIAYEHGLAGPGPGAPPEPDRLTGSPGHATVDRTPARHRATRTPVSRPPHDRAGVTGHPHGRRATRTVTGPPAPSAGHPHGHLEGLGDPALARVRTGRPGGRDLGPHGLRVEVMAATPGWAATKYPPVTPSASARCPFAAGTMAAELDFRASHLSEACP